MTTGAAVELRGVSRRYRTGAGEVRAVDGVTMDVPAGGSVSITGPSGCGKSTLLALIGALDHPTEGRVTIGGEDVSSMSDPDRARLRRHEVGFVFQSDDLLPFLTAAENVAFRRSLGEADAALDESRALLSELGLAREADALPDRLSGGQRQRVAVARALVHRPRLLVADEPTGSLDADSAGVVMELLLGAQRRSGATLVLVTHDVGVAARLDRTVSMRDGHLVDRGATTAGPGA